jgi:hypothetical protein
MQPRQRPCSVFNISSIVLCFCLSGVLTLTPENQVADPKDVSPYLDDLIPIIKRSIVDHSPEMRECAVSVCFHDKDTLSYFFSASYP